MSRNLLNIFLWFANVFLLFVVPTQTEKCGFSQWVDPPDILPYQEYIDYLEDVVIYNLKRELSKALASQIYRLAQGMACW
jgi:hypothetical protein